MVVFFNQYCINRRQAHREAGDECLFLRGHRCPVEFASALLDPVRQPLQRVAASANAFERRVKRVPVGLQHVGQYLQPVSQTGQAARLQQTATEVTGHQHVLCFAL